MQSNFVLALPACSFVFSIQIDFSLFPDHISFFLQLSRQPLLFLPIVHFFFLEIIKTGSQRKKAFLLHGIDCQKCNSFSLSSSNFSGRRGQQFPSFFLHATFPQSFLRLLVAPLTQLMAPDTNTHSTARAGEQLCTVPQILVEHLVTAPNPFSGIFFWSMLTAPYHLNQEPYTRLL